MQPRWLVEALADVARSDVAEIPLLIVGERGTPHLPWTWRAYERLDRWVFGVRPEPSQALNLPLRLPRARVIQPPTDGAGEVAWRAWLSLLGRHRLDVLLFVGEGSEAHDLALAGVARYGVWRLRFGARQLSSHALAGYGEVARAETLSSSCLTARLEGGRERLLYQSCTRTAPFSATRNHDKLVARTAHFPLRALTELQRHGAAWLATCARHAPPNDLAPAEKPGAALGLARVGARMARRAAQKLIGIDQWFLGWRFDGDAGDSRVRPETPGQYACLMPPRDRFWADPFPIERDGRHFIFFEELPFPTGKGHISVIEMDRCGACSEPQRVLERDYHLSYPFLVETDGALFMVPETGQNRSVEVYRCVEFPHRWQLEKVLIEGRFCVDASFHRAQGLWWMFVNIGTDGGDVHDELHVYYAEHFLGPWQPHRVNPVKSDVRSARPAGRPFERDGRLYRPAQICAPLYGAGLVIHQVLELTPDSYRERPVGRILPGEDSAILGVHTFNRAGQLSVIDGFMRRPRFGTQLPAVFAPRYVPDAAVSPGGPRAA